MSANFNFKTVSSLNDYLNASVTLVFRHCDISLSIAANFRLLDFAFFTMASGSNRPS